MVEYYKNSEGGQLQDKRVLVNSWARPPRRRGLTRVPSPCTNNNVSAYISEMSIAVDNDCFGFIVPTRYIY